MDQEMITIEDFCQYYRAEITFIRSLEDSGLIAFIQKDDIDYIGFDEMPRLEKFVRMHYDLDINVEGLETIDHLLQKIEELQREVLQFRTHHDEL
ncbi:MAG: hypothetical protein J0H55_08200 [Chitinophagaceae bacterium]|nr:hypothetical protein [Chitinophagaceae bacterium]